MERYQERERWKRRRRRGKREERAYHSNCLSVASSWLIESDDETSGSVPSVSLRTRALAADAELRPEMDGRCGVMGGWAT